MSRKLYGGLLPILAVVAFASMAASSQAATHWFRCEHSVAKTHKYNDSSCSVENAKKEGEYERVELPLEKEGKVTKFPVKTFGQLSLTIPVTGQSVTCLVDDHGRIWNRLASNNGLDEIQVFENYECTSNFCEEGLSLTALGLPWPTELVTGPPIRDKIGTAANPVKVQLLCTKPPANLVFEGTVEPEFINGTPANGGTSFARFEATAGLKTSGGLAATVGGNDFVIGVERAETILAF